MKVVLIVEDLLKVQDAWARMLEGKVILLQARTIRDAQRLFTENSPCIDLIAMDACVPGDKPNTLELVKTFRETFKGPMIAMSSDEDYRFILMEAGCDYECPKGELMSAIIRLLKL